MEIRVTGHITHAQKWVATRCGGFVCNQTDEGTKKRWHIYNMGYHLTIRKRTWEWGCGSDIKMFSHHTWSPGFNPQHIYPGHGATSLSSQLLGSEGKKSENSSHLWLLIKFGPLEGLRETLACDLKHYGFFFLKTQCSICILPAQQKRALEIIIGGYVPPSRQPNTMKI